MKLITKYKENAWIIISNPTQWIKDVVKKKRNSQIWLILVWIGVDIFVTQSVWQFDILLCQKVDIDEYRFNFTISFHTFEFGRILI